MLAAPTIFLDPNLMQAILIYAFAAAVLGGIDSPFGAVVGGLLLGVGLNLIEHVRRLRRRRPAAARGAPDHPRRPARPAGRALRQAGHEARMRRPRSRAGVARASSLAVVGASSCCRADQRLPRAAVRVRRHLLHRAPRAQPAHRLHRPDLARPRRLHADRRLHDRDPDVEPGSAARARSATSSRAT